jgi:uncharacterized UBP type Zn finger protein
VIPYRPEIVQDARGINPNGSAPRCEHVDTLAAVTPRASTCRACQASGTAWTSLMVCLTCGWVACSDDSPQRHALAHYNETDHPVVRPLEPGPAWRWCYVHHRAV